MPSKQIDQPLLILGTRTLAAEIADLASEVAGVHVAGFVENEDRARCEETLEGLPIHWIDDIAGMKDSHVAIGGLMTTHRGRFADQVDAIGMPFATLVHPTARISPTATLADGCIVSAGVIIGAHARLGRHVFVNRGALIGHHTEIGELTSLGPGVNICASCRIGERVYLGAGAIVVDHLGIGERSVIGAGALVLEDLPERVTAVGHPAHIIKRDIDGK